MVRPVINVGRGSILLVLLVIAGGVTAGLVYGSIRTQQVEDELLRLAADDVPSHETLVAFSTERGPYLFVDHCATCHGEDMRGDKHRGVPDLQDSFWLFGDGHVSDIENTIQYGVRSGHPKAHNITDMPAFLRTRQLSAAEIGDVVEFVLAIRTKAIASIATARTRSVIRTTARLRSPVPHGSTVARAPSCSSRSRMAVMACAPRG
jgi:mono/diheme cytochrome c family protein